MNGFLRISIYPDDGGEPTIHDLALTDLDPVDIGTKLWMKAPALIYLTLIEERWSWPVGFIDVQQ